MLHSLLPHVPYLYLPSTKAYGIEVPILRGIQQGVWKQTFPALQSEQRFLLQTEYTDRALGYMMRRLRRGRIFDKAPWKDDRVPVPAGDFPPYAPPWINERPLDRALVK